MRRRKCALSAVPSSNPAPGNRVFVQQELREQAIKRQRLKEEREREDEKQAKLDSLKKSRVSVDHRDDDADSRKPAIKKKKFKSGLF